MSWQSNLKWLREGDRTGVVGAEDPELVGGESAVGARRQPEVQELEAERVALKPGHAPAAAFCSRVGQRVVCRGYEPRQTRHPAAAFRYLDHRSV